MHKPTNSLHIRQVGVLILVRRCRKEIILLHRSVHLVDRQLQFRIVVVHHVRAQPRPHHAWAHETPVFGHVDALRQVLFGACRCESLRKLSLSVCVGISLFIPGALVHTWLVATLSLRQIVDFRHQTAANGGRILRGILLLGRKVCLALVLQIVLVLLDLLQLRVDLHLKSLVLTLEVFALVHQVRHLLIPLGPLPFVVQKKLSLLALCLACLLLYFPLLRVKGFPLLFQFAAHLCNLAVSFCLHQVMLLLEAFKLVGLLFILLIKICEFNNLITTIKLQLLVKLGFVTLKLLYLLLQLQVGASMRVGDFFNPLVEFLFHLKHHRAVLGFSLVLAFGLNFLQLFDR